MPESLSGRKVLRSGPISPNSRAYEHKISKTGLSATRSPRGSENRVSEQELEIDFCKNYAGIQIAEDAVFNERMQFDIYKRATKEQRMLLLLDLNKQRIPKKEQEKLYERLIDDGKKWNQRKKQIETYTQSETNRSRAEAKKLTKEESDQLYARMMRQHWEKEQELMRKRASIQCAKKQEEVSATQRNGKVKSMVRSV